MLCERGERNESSKETDVRTKLAMMVQSREDDVLDPPLYRETNVAGSEEKVLNFFHEGEVSEVGTEKEKRYSRSYMYESSASLLEGSNKVQREKAIGES